MMWHFFKRMDRNKAEDRLAGTVAAIILRYQLKIADWLERKDKRLKAHVRKRFYLILGAVSFFWIAALTVPLFRPDTKRIKAERLHLPRDSTHKWEKSKPSFPIDFQKHRSHNTNNDAAKK